MKSTTWANVYSGKYPQSKPLFSCNWSSIGWHLGYKITNRLASPLSHREGYKFDLVMLTPALKILFNSHGCWCDGGVTPRNLAYKLLNITTTYNKCNSHECMNIIVNAYTNGHRGLGNCIHHTKHKHRQNDNNLMTTPR